MPLRMVWPDSWSVETRNDGSSAASFASAMPSFSWSAFVFGSIAISTSSGCVLMSSGIAQSQIFDPDLSLVGRFRRTAHGKQHDRPSPLDALILPLPQFLQHPRHQIEPRRDRAGVDIFVAGVIPVTGQPKAFDHDSLAAAVG